MAYENDLVANANVNALFFFNDLQHWLNIGDDVAHCLATNVVDLVRYAFVMCLHIADDVVHCSAAAVVDWICFAFVVCSYCWFRLTNNRVDLQYWLHIGDWVHIATSPMLWI